MQAGAVTVPASVESLLKLLGGAASPCALVALGLFLAEARPRRTVVGGTVVALAALKLLLQPALTFVLARSVARLPPDLTRTAVLLTSLPTGTDPFMLAEFYRRDADVTACVVLVSTVVSVVTVSAVAAMIR